MSSAASAGSAAPITTGAMQKLSGPKLGRALFRVRRRDGRAAAQFDRQTLGGGENFHLRAGAPALPHRFNERVDLVVGARRIMVGERQAPRARRGAEEGRVFAGAVAPADLAGEFGGRVLGVVDHEVGVGEELGMMQILAGNDAAARGKLVGMGFVVAGVDQRRAIRDDSR